MKERMDNKGVLIRLRRGLRPAVNRPSGQMAILIIVVLAVLILFIAVLTNIGKLAHRKAQMENAADKAALSLGSQLGSLAYQYSQKACGGGTTGGWKRSFSFIFKVLAVVVAVVALCYQQYYVAAVVIGMLGMGLTLYSEFVLDPKQLDALNRQLARIEENLRYSEAAMQNAFIYSITDPNKVGDTYDYDEDEDTTDEITQYTKWQYERLEELSKETGVVEAYKREKKDELIAEFKEFVDKSGKMCEYLAGDFKTVLIDLHNEDVSNDKLDFSAELAFFEDVPSFATYAAPEPGEEPLNRINYLIYDIKDLTMTEIDNPICIHYQTNQDGEEECTRYITIPDEIADGVITVADEFIYLLKQDSLSWFASLLLNSLLLVIKEDWSLWKDDLKLWGQELGSIKGKIEARLIVLGNCDTCCPPGCTICDCTCDTICDVCGQPCLDEKARLEALRSKLEDAVTKVSAFIEGAIEPFVNVLEETIEALGVGDNYVPARSLTYGWEDSLGVHYVRVEVSDYKIPYLQIETDRKWYGKKQRYVLTDYNDTATINITGFDQSKQLYFAGGKKLWDFRYTKARSQPADPENQSCSVLDNYGYSASATVQWGKYTGSWKLPYIESTSATAIDVDCEDFIWEWGK